MKIVRHYDKHSGEAIFAVQMGLLPPIESGSQ